MITLNLHTPDRCSIPAHESFSAPEQISVPVSQPIVTPAWEPVFTRFPLQAEIPDAVCIALSKRLGLNSIPPALAELEQVLREETLGIYDYAKVTAYLDEQCRQLTEQKRSRPWSGDYQEYRWHWHPIQEYKLPFLQSVNWLPSQSRELYNKPIPTEILPTIDRIQERVPEALFYVSDLQDFRDPFLAVTVLQADKLHVLERWHEPRFRG